MRKRVQAVPGVESTLTRVSHETAGDIPCDARARTRISGVEAYARGKLERNLNNFNGSVRWFHMAAELGDPEGEAEYGTALIFGNGYWRHLESAVEVACYE